jgi:hypothetical protein
MGIKVENNMIDPEEFINYVELILVDMLDETLAEIIEIAKKKNTYVDRTKNLRSSIGYMIYKDGAFVKSNFKTDGSGEDGNGTVGVEVGKKIADEVGKSFSSGYVCVLVAGMDYALYVESKGFYVLTGSWMEFDSVFKKNAENIHLATGINFKQAK